MKKKLKLTVVLLAFLFIGSSLFAQDSTKAKNKSQNKTDAEMQLDSKAQKGKNFVDADGDGYNDNAPDHDGDGIPNGLDDDFLGSGKNGFVDLDGDGINDNSKRGKAKGQGMKDNFGHKGAGNSKDVSPQSGNVSGMGNHNDGTENGGGKVRRGKKGMGGN